MKTIKQWLETLPNPIKEKALANLIKDREDKEEENLSDALYEAFYWSKADEGYNYWYGVDMLAQSGDFNKKEEEQHPSFPREVYVDNISEAEALKNNNKRICLGKFNWKYLCVNYWEEEIYNKIKHFEAVFWKYIAEIPKEKTLTIETKDGQSIEISEKQAIELWFTIN